MMIPVGLVCEWVLRAKHECFLHQLQMKVVTSGIFKGKKDSYPRSIPQPFLDTRISAYNKLQTHLVQRSHCVTHRSFETHITSLQVNRTST